MILGVIPSRYASTRFPGKPLADIAGISMVERVYRQAEKSKRINKLVVATDDERILQHVLQFGGVAVMTSPDHPSGTDRCYEAFTKAEGSFEFIINIQGDEPFIDPSHIDALADMIMEPSAEIATLICPVQEAVEIFDPGTVKVVLNNRKEALYFSRQAIPFLRDQEHDEWHNRFTYYRHTGLYAYRSEILKYITSLPPSPLEQAEKLEQLRWLENGVVIRCGITSGESYPVDVPGDIPKILKARGTE